MAKPLSRRKLLAGTALAAAGVGAGLWVRDPHSGGVDHEVMQRPPGAPGALPPAITPIDEHYIFHAHRTPSPQSAEEASLWLSNEEGNKDILTWAEALDGLPRTKIPATLACDGNGFPLGTIALPRIHRTWTRWGWRYGGIGTHVWDAVSIRELLEKHGRWEERRAIEFYARDGEDLGLPIDEVESGRAFLAVGIDGVPLPHLRGGPARLIMRGHWGARSLKWISQIHLIDEEAQWIERDHPAHAVRPFAFCSTHKDGATVGRTLEVGGGAYAGTNPVAKVSVMIDREEALDARLLETPEPFRMVRWTREITLPPGPHELTIRCEDDQGRRSVNRRRSDTEGWDEDHHLRVIVG